MKERPIPFSGPMVRAILAGRKTQTRRTVKPQPVTESNGVAHWPNPWPARCPYGQPGDRLWVREAWRTWAGLDKMPPRDMAANGPVIHYECSPLSHINMGKLRPGMFMPRWASRILLEVVAVRVERLNDISEEDAIAEGVFKKIAGGGIGDLVETIDGGQAVYISRGQAKMSYWALWEQIHGPGSWDVNPWVWVVEFKRVAP